MAGPGAFDFRSAGVLWPTLPHAPAPSRVRAHGPIRHKRRETLAGLEAPQKVLFLDIETTGLSRHYDELTLVGYALGGEHRVHVSGDDPGPMLDAFRSAVVTVTFNGTLFDLPFLKDAFPTLALPDKHIDLRFAARRAGLTGGQKAIEKQLGIDLRRGLEDLDGEAAVLLWHRYLRGDAEALRKLIRYNEADVAAMRCILDVVRAKLAGDGALFGFHRFAEDRPLPVGYGAPGATLPPASRLGKPKRTFAGLFGEAPASLATVVGIDLTGSEARPSGVCVLRGCKAETSMVHADDGLIAAVVAAAPDLVSIDSPLSLPKGRVTVFDDDPGRQAFGIMRVNERMLKRRGVNVYPCLLPSMQRLTARGMALAARLRSLGIPVIESYPGAAQDIIGIPRKGAGEHLLKAGLGEFGIHGAYLEKPVKHDELDAITSALVGTFFLAGRYEALTGPDEGELVIPDMKHDRRPKLVIGISGRIGAGKTTAANHLATKGFAYTRVSQMVDAVIEAEGGIPDRASRQEVGWRLHVERGQPWLLDKALEIAGDGDFIVIDGLRFPEDHAHLVERFGAGFHHVHVVASTHARAVRCGTDPAHPVWVETEQGLTESRIEALGEIAHYRIGNDSDLAAFQESIDVTAKEALKGSAACQSP